MVRTGGSHPSNGGSIPPEANWNIFFRFNDSLKPKGSLPAGRQGFPLGVYLIIMRNKYLIIIILLTAVFFISNYSLAQDDLLDEVQDAAPPILPDFINEGADQQIKNWQKIFGDEFVDIINAMEAVKTGDVQTFVRSGVNIIKVTPEILPRLGLDLIIPVNDNYLGGVKIDPADIYSGIELDSQKIEIENINTNKIENLILRLAVTGYSADFVEIKKIISDQALEIVSDEIAAKTREKISLDEGKIYLKEKKDENEIKRLPSYALREVNSRYKKFNYNKIKLEFKDGKPVYNIEGKIDGKILWIIPIKADMEAEYDARKGLINKINKPWWEVFIF